jgi:hypothetical protein
VSPGTEARKREGWGSLLEGAGRVGDRLREIVQDVALSRDVERRVSYILVTRKAKAEDPIRSAGPDV